MSAAVMTSRASIAPFDEGSNNVMRRAERSQPQSRSHAADQGAAASRKKAIFTSSNAAPSTTAHPRMSSAPPDHPMNQQLHVFEDAEDSPPRRFHEAVHDSWLSDHDEDYGYESTSEPFILASSKTKLPRASSNRSAASLDCRHRPLSPRFRRTCSSRHPPTAASSPIRAFLKTFNSNKQRKDNVKEIRMTSCPSLSGTRGTTTDQGSTTSSVSSLSCSSSCFESLFVLLLNPETKIFELIQLSFVPNTTTVRDILAMIPSNITERSLGEQSYVGLTRPKKRAHSYSGQSVIVKSGSRHALSTSNLGVLPDEVLAGLPDGYTRHHIVRLSKKILLNPRIQQLMAQKAANKQPPLQHQQAEFLLRNRQAALLEEERLTSQALLSSRQERQSAFEQTTGVYSTPPRSNKTTVSTPPSEANRTPSGYSNHQKVASSAPHDIGKFHQSKPSSKRPPLSPRTPPPIASCLSTAHHHHSSSAFSGAATTRPSSPSSPRTKQSRKQVKVEFENDGVMAATPNLSVASSGSAFSSPHSVSSPLLCSRSPDDDGSYSAWSHSLCESVRLRCNADSPVSKRYSAPPVYRPRRSRRGRMTSKPHHAASTKKLSQVVAVGLMVAIGRYSQVADQYASLNDELYRQPLGLTGGACFLVALLLMVKLQRLACQSHIDWSRSKCPLLRLIAKYT